MFSPAQQKRLGQVEKELTEICFARMEFTLDNSKRGVEEWDRLWKRQGELLEELEKLKEAQRAAP